MPFIKLFLVFLTFTFTTFTYASERIAPDLNRLVKLAKKANSPAEVLYLKQHVELDENNRSKTTTYVAVRINSDDAVRDFSQVRIGYNSFFSSLSLDFARVRAKNGKIYNLEKDAVIDKPKGGEYLSDSRVVQFALPSVEAGSVIEYQYVREVTNPVIDGHHYDYFIFNGIERSKNSIGVRIDYVAKAELLLTAPSSTVINHKTPNNVSLTKKTNGNRTEYLWSIKKLEEVPVHDHMPRLWRYLTVVEYSTMSSWTEVTKWSNDLYSPAVDTSGNIKSIAKRIKKKTSNTRDQIFEAYRYMQDNIRYVFAHVGRGGYRPHQALEVLENRYGDCKDQTILLISLLKALGIKAYPAFVNTGGGLQPSQQVPLVIFDHVFVYVPQENGDDIWLDTTGEKMLFPGYDGSLGGNKALVVQGDQGSLIELPGNKHIDNGVWTEIVFKPLENEQLSAEFTMTFKGQYESHMRYWWRHSENRQQETQQTLKGFYNGLVVREVHASDIDDLSKPLTLKGVAYFDEDGTQPERMSYAVGAVQLLRAFSNVDTLPLAEGIKQDVEVFDNYRLNLRVEIEPPRKEMEPLLVRPALSVKNEYFDLTQTSNAVGNQFQIDIQLDINAQIIPKEKYPQLLDELDKVSKSNNWVVLYKNKEDTSANLLVDKSSSVSNGTAQSIEGIRSLLDNGNFEQALESAEKFVKQHPKSGEAYYLVGLAQGYLDQFDESDKSFDKARSLGYDF